MKTERKKGSVGDTEDLPVETVSASAIADHQHRYKLTGVTQYVCVSSPVRRMSLSLHVTCDNDQSS